MTEDTFFTNWTDLLRIAVLGVGAYAGLILLFRASGNRTLSKMKALDFVITVAFGSAMASVLLGSVSLAEGLVGFAVLVLLRFAVTWASVRGKWVKRLVITGEPQLLFHEGAWLSRACRRTRVTADEIRAAMRSSGLDSERQAHAVILETDGSFSVIPHHDARTALRSGASADPRADAPARAHRFPAPSRASVITFASTADVIGSDSSNGKNSRGRRPGVRNAPSHTSLYTPRSDRSH